MTEQEEVQKVTIETLNDWPKVTTRSWGGDSNHDFLAEAIAEAIVSHLGCGPWIWEHLANIVGSEAFSECPVPNEDAKDAPLARKFLTSAVALINYHYERRNSFRKST